MYEPNNQLPLLTIPIILLSYYSSINSSNTSSTYYPINQFICYVIDGGIKAIPSLRQMHPSRCADSGIFSLGSPSLDRRAMEYIMKRYPVRTDDVIISGTGIAAYAAISSLINMGIASNRITLLVKSEEQIVDETLDKFVSIYIHLYIYLSIVL